MISSAQRIVLRYAKYLSNVEFDQLMKWLGPKAYEAHQKFPKGVRFFNTTSRVFKFNITPEDYLKFSISETKEMLAGGATIKDIVNPVAYKAMEGVFNTLRKRKIPYKLVKVPLTDGGSYIQAKMPQKKEPNILA